MLIADTIGIIIGIVLGKKIPERLVKWFAALIFILFGIIGLYSALPKNIWIPPVVIGCTVVLFLSIYVVYRMNKNKSKAQQVCETPNKVE
jgi:xanthine/uracil permease